MSYGTVFPVKGEEVLFFCLCKPVGDSLGCLRFPEAACGLNPSLCGVVFDRIDLLR